MAGVLLILVVLSYYHPEALHRYIGVKPPVAANTTGAVASGQKVAESASTPKPVLIPPPAGVHVISYENYTSFPLNGQEYLEECHKLNSGYMAHGDFWDASPMGAYDVPHLDDKSICSSTITYMLDGTVGLTADLALMAQVAALAAEVCTISCRLVDAVLTSCSGIGHFLSRIPIGIEGGWSAPTWFMSYELTLHNRWLDHFEDVRILQPGPQPGCKAPPPEGISELSELCGAWRV